MPKLTKVFTLAITPEQFLENCSDLELKELDLLIQMPRYSHRIVQLQELEIKKNTERKKIKNHTL